MFIEFVFLSSPHFLRQNDSTPNSGFQIKSTGCKSEEEKPFCGNKENFFFLIFMKTLIALNRPVNMVTINYRTLFMFLNYNNVCSSKTVKIFPFLLKTFQESS